MTLRAALIGLVLLACAAAADAATLEGRVTHPTRPNAGAKLLIEVLGLDKEENPISRSTTSDATGHYRFDNLPSPAAYLVRAHYDGLAFPGGSTAFRSGDPAQKQTLDFQVYDQTTDGSKLKLTSLQWVIGRSAGVWRIQQSATIANPSQEVVLVPPPQPAPVTVGVAPGHGPLDTMMGRLPEGVQAQNATAEIRGPVFPGEQGFLFQVEYDLEQKGDLATEIAVPTGVEDLTVYVQDFGIDVDAGDLHPARPARQDDQIYQAFLGFDVPPGARLPLHVRVLPPASPLPQSLVVLLAALGAGALLYYVGAPLVRDALVRAPRPDESLEPESPAKAALAAALRDLEHDFETGKLSIEDRERLRTDLRREALAALVRERGASHSAPPEPAAPAAACSCGRMPSAGDRFCAACGRPL